MEGFLLLLPLQLLLPQSPRRGILSAWCRAREQRENRNERDRSHVAKSFGTEGRPGRPCETLERDLRNLSPTDAIDLEGSMNPAIESGHCITSRAESRSVGGRTIAGGMTIFERDTPAGRTRQAVMPGEAAKPKKYDIRVVDRFYVQCRTAAEIESRRADLLRSWQTTKRLMWTVAVGSTVVCYYVLDKVLQATALL